MSSAVTAAAAVSKEELARIGQEKLRHDFFLAFSGQGPFANGEISTAAECVGLPSSFRVAAAFFLQLRGWQTRRQNLEEEERLSFRQAFQEMLQTFLARHQDDFTGWPFLLDKEHGCYGLVLISLAAVSRAAVPPKLYELSHHLQTLVERYFDLRLLLVRTAPQSDWSHLMTGFQALLAKKDALFYLSAGIYTAEELPDTKTSTQVSTDLPAKKLLPLLAKENLTREALLEFLQKSFAALPKSAWNQIQQAEDYESLQRELCLLLRQEQAYFSTLFKKNMNNGFSEYLAERRIKAVCQRLAGSTERIKDIAAAEGFDDYPYFCRLFKRLVGLAPQEYRSQKI